MSPDMEEVMDTADAVLATGMTLGNGTFDRIRARGLERRIPLGIYAQSAPAVAASSWAAGSTP